MIDPPAKWIVVQGRKICYVGKQRFNFRPGNIVVTLYPMSVEYEIADASPNQPYLLAGVILDMERLANVLLRLDRIDGAAPNPFQVILPASFRFRSTITCWIHLSGFSPHYPIPKRLPF